MKPPRKFVVLAVIMQIAILITAHWAVTARGENIYAWIGFVLFTSYQSWYGVFRYAKLINEMNNVKS